MVVKPIMWCENKRSYIELILAYMQSLTRYRNGLLLIDWAQFMVLIVRE